MSHLAADVNGKVTMPAVQNTVICMLCNLGVVGVSYYAQTPAAFRSISLAQFAMAA